MAQVFLRKKNTDETFSCRTTDPIMERVDDDLLIITKTEHERLIKKREDDAARKKKARLEGREEPVVEPAHVTQESLAQAPAEGAPEQKPLAEMSRNELFKVIDDEMLGVQKKGTKADLVELVGIARDAKAKKTKIKGESDAAKEAVGQ